MLWAKDNKIGALSGEWNHLIGYDKPSPKTKLAHFTLGTPDIPGHENDEFADEWLAYIEPGEMPTKFGVFDKTARDDSTAKSFKKAGQ
jgi:hypothetical protein